MEQNYETIGQRLAYCRQILGISRPEMLNLIGGLSEKTLYRYENEGKVPIAQLERLIHFYNDQGIIVSKEWILVGTGAPPINSNLVGQYNFDDITYLAYNGLKQNIRGIEMILVDNDFFEPVIKTGDYIFGIISETIKSLTNKLCFIRSKKGVVVGIFNYELFCLKNINKDVFKIDPDDFKIGQVLWLSVKPEDLG